MKRTLSTPLILFIGLLALAGLACNALSPGTSTETRPVSDTDAVVSAAVATVQAQLPVSDTPTINTSTSAVITADTNVEAALINLYQHVNPSVVFIIASIGNLDASSGSGFVYDSDGHIVTNNHVVAQAETFEVVFADGRRRRADIVGTDVDSDLAVMKVESLPADIRPVTLSSFNDIQVGEFAVAIGNPFGEQGSMTLGIVSALGRSITSQRVADSGGTYSLPQVIQTDAPINPGNSGGPLLNLQGEVIGVNSAIRSSTRSNSGVGFAIPVAAVRQIVPSLIANGSYTYPYMGIGSTGFAIDLDAQEAWDLPRASGVYVTNVTPGTPADEAGIIPAPDGGGTGGVGPGGDLIVGIDGQEVKEFNDLISYLVFETEVGQTVNLTVLRDGEEITVPLTLGARP